MSIEKGILEKLEKMLAWKKSRTFYMDKLDITSAELDELLRELRGKDQTPENQLVIDFEGESKRINKEKGTLESTVISSFEPKNDEELAKLHKVDLTKYKISSYWTKQKGDKFTSSLLCTLIKPDEFSQDRFESFLKEYKTSYKPFVKYTKNKGETVDVEISLADVHLDKLDVTKETIEERKGQYLRVLANLLNNTTLYDVDTIAFVVGNDFFHTDTFQGTTTNGTPLDISTTWYNAYEEGFDLLVKAIEMLMAYARNIEVILVQGNHARTKEYYLAHALQAYFRNEDRIYFEREMNNIKYTVLGNTFIGYHHGNCKLDDLPLIFATSEYSCGEFGTSKYREVHTGDKHHYMVKEVKGVRVQQLPSLAGTDRWHADNNFVHNIRAGLVMVYHPEKGKIAEFEERV